jgi:hypothetical protein
LTITDLNGDIPNEQTDTAISHKLTTVLIRVAKHGRYLVQKCFGVVFALFLSGPVLVL